MATEHTLKLRAILDTSEVKSELNRLRQNQQNATQSGSSVGFNGNISSVLRNLNTSIQNLQRSIDRLTGLERQNVKTLTQPTAIVPSLSRYVGRSSVRTRSASTYGNITGPLNEITRQYEDLFGAPGSFGRGIRNDLQRARRTLRQTYFGGRSASSAYRVMQELDSAGYSAAEMFMENNPTLRGFQNNVTNFRRHRALRNIGLESSRYGRFLDEGPVDRRAIGMRQMGIRLGASFVLGGMSEYAAARGDDTASKAMRFGSNIAGGAAMGMMFGPQGAALGALFGAAKSGLDLLTESAKNAALALDAQSARVAGAAGADKTVYEFFRGLNDEKALKEKDVGYFQQQLESATTRYNVAKGFLKSSGIGIEEGSLEAYEKETLAMEQIKQGKFKPKTISERRLLSRYGGMDEEQLASSIKFRNETADEYKRLAGELSGYKGRVDEVTKIIEDLKKPAEATKKEQKPKLDTLTPQIETLQDRLSGMRAPGLENVNSLAAQGFMISRSDDEARMQESNDYLRDIAQITREIKNLEKEKETSTYL